MFTFVPLASKAAGVFLHKPAGEHVAMERMWQWRGCGYGEDVAMESMWLWRGCGYGEDVAMESMWLWRACGYG